MATKIDERLICLHLDSPNIISDTKKINMALRSNEKVFINIHNGNIIKRIKTDEWVFLAADGSNDKYVWRKYDRNDNDFFESESYIPLEFGLEISKNNLKSRTV